MTDDNMTIDEKERLDLIEQFNKEFPESADDLLDYEKVNLMRILNHLFFMDNLESEE